MADGSIRFTAEIDDRDAQKALAKLERDIGKTQAAIQKSTATRNGIAESLRQAQKEAVAAYNEVERLERELKSSQEKTSPNYRGNINATQFTAELENQQRLTAELEEQRKVVAQKEAEAMKLEAQDAKIVAQLEQQTAELEKQSGQANDINAQLAQQGTSAWPQIKEASAAAMDGVQKAMKKGFRTLLKYGLGIRSVYILFRRLRSVLVEGIKEFANYDAETKANIDGLKASLQGLKGSFVALAAPIFNAVAPALQHLIEWVTSAIDAVSAFIAILGGKSTYKRAVTGISSAAGAISDAAGAAKELDRYMSGLDEMQKWQSDSSSGGGSGGGSGGSSGGLAWEDVPIDMDSNIAQFAMRVQDIFFDWSDLTYEQIAEKAITALSMISGAIIGGTIGGVPGAIIGLVAGATLGVLASETLFNHDGVLSKDEIVNLIIPVLGAILGGLIGLSAGPAGVLLGASIGFAVTLLIETLDFENRVSSPAEWLIKAIFGDKMDSETTATFAKWLETTLSNWKTLLQLKWDSFWKNNKIISSVSDFISNPDDLGEKVIEALNKPFEKLQDWADNLLPDTKFGERLREWFQPDESGLSSIAKTIKKKMANIANAVIDPLNQLISNITTALAGTKFGEWLADKLGLGSLTDLQIPRVEVDVTANLTDTKDSIPKDKKTVAGMTSEFSKRAYSTKYSKIIPGMTSEFSRRSIASSYNKTITGMTSEFSKKSIASGFNKDVTGMNAVLKTKDYASGFNYQITKMIGVLKTYTFSSGWKIPQAFATALFKWYGFSSAWKTPYAFTTATFKWHNFSSVWKTPWAYMTAYFNEHKFASAWKKPWAYMKAYFDSYAFSSYWTKPWAYVTAYFKETGGVYYNGAWRPFGQYASGGMPTGGQLFVAREAGPELVGTLKGRTAVMNNDQIVASVAAGVAKAIAGIEFHMEGLPTYQPVTPDKYPSIAQGGVIPPKILEAIDKLSEIKAAIDNLSAKLSNSGGNNSYQFTAQLDRRTLFDELIEEAQMRRNQSGLNPFMAV